MKRLLRELLFGAAMGALVSSFMWASPAYAQVFYGNVGWWNINAFLETLSCDATATYDNGLNLAVSFLDNGEAALLGVGGFQTIPGKTYRLNMSGSTGRSYIEMEGIGDGLASVLTPAGVQLMKQSTYLSIQGIGDFDLKGSAAAMNQAWECSQVVYEAVNGLGGHVSEPAPPTGRDGPKLWM